MNTMQYDVVCGRDSVGPVNVSFVEFGGHTRVVGVIGESENVPIKYIIFVPSCFLSNPV